MDALHDPIVQRFIPERDTVARAQRQMMANETHQERFVRQRWEEACGANRVALAALRDIFPSELHGLDDEERRDFMLALDCVTAAFNYLDALTESMIGITMQNVLNGVYTAADLDSLGVPRDET